MNKNKCTPRQIKWLDDNNITTCDQLYSVTMNALRTWKSSPRGSKERKEAYTTYFTYCKKIFPKAYYIFVHHESTKINAK